MSRLILLLTLTFFSILSSCELPDRQAPEADFSIQPRFGDSLTVFHFDASNSSDNYTDNFRLKVRWDINSDGQWESDYTILKDFSFRFPGNGTYSITCELIDDQKNTSSITKLLQVVPVPRDSVFTDYRDGRKYKAVFLFDKWWMKQNLNYGIPLLDSLEASDNSIAEKYPYPNASYDSLYGAYYSWNEATDYGRELVNGICPEGWSLPVQNDINRIKDILFFTDNYTPYLAINKQFMLDLALSGKYFISKKIWHRQGISGNFWINHKQPYDKFISWIYFSKNVRGRYVIAYNPMLLTDYQPLDTEIVEWQNIWGEFSYHKVALPIRCIKDHEIN